MRDVFFIIVISLVLGLSCVCCGSTRKAVTEDKHSVDVGVGESMETSSSVQSLLTNNTDNESLHIVIEEFNNICNVDTTIHKNSKNTHATSSSNANITRRITIDRNKQHTEHSSSQTQVKDSVTVSIADSTATDSRNEVKQDIAVNTSQWGFSEFMLLFFLLFVVSIIIREYIYFRNGSKNKT